jgi:hypothetical protein
MANEVINILTVLGDTSDVKEVFKTIISDKDEFFNISFNQFIPMPLDIKKTASPVWLMEQEDYDNWMRKYGETNREFFDGYPITEDMQQDLLDKYGVDTWEKWAINYWGCKWDVQGTVSLGKMNKVKFWTADNTPYNAMVTLSRLFPNVKLKVEYADEDLGVNVGLYYLVNGEMVDSHTPKALSNEAYSMAMDITGDEYYITGFLETMSENDAKEEFPEMCIEIAYEKRKATDKFPVFILKQFEKWAVRDEDYEFASEIKSICDG